MPLYDTSFTTKISVLPKSAHSRCWHFQRIMSTHDISSKKSKHGRFNRTTGVYVESFYHGRYSVLIPLEVPSYTVQKTKRWCSANLFEVNVHKRRRQNICPSLPMLTYYSNISGEFRHVHNYRTCVQLCAAVSNATLATSTRKNCPHLIFKKSQIIQLSSPHANH